jgi:TonB family protein
MLARSGIVLVLGLAFAPNPVSAAAPTRTPTAVRSDCAMVEAVLTPDGHVRSARIAKSADTQFDRRALAFVKARRYAVPKENTKPLYLSVAVCLHELR